METKARIRSVENLQHLYTVIVSLAIAESLRRLISDWGASGAFPDISAFIAVISLLVTIIPFYHGANRYLDSTYITEERSAKPGSLMLDFIVFFLEGLIFFILAILIHRTDIFFTLLSFLFFFDAIWVGISKLTSETRVIQGFAYLPWAIINLGAGILILISVWSNVIRFTIWYSLRVQIIALCLITVFRSVADYLSAWKFYYPPPKG